MKIRRKLISNKPQYDWVIEIEHSKETTTQIIDDDDDRICSLKNRNKYANRKNE